VNFEITERSIPSNTPYWVNFKKTVCVDVINRFTKSFCFPIFTDKILAFNGDISLSIYDQAFYDNLKDFDTGENIEHWIKLYWDSVISLEEYLNRKPYPIPKC